ncbi:MAG TPA: DEAD/DEAH box helicase [Longimicrobiales bacterium]
MPDVLRRAVGGNVRRLILRETRTLPRAVPGAVAAAHILRDRFGEAQTSGVTSDGLFEFQREAVTRARAILARRGGVLIADSVGLGKTHVARELLRPAFEAGARVTVVGPAALARHWRAALHSSGAFEWCSYARLSRGRVSEGRRDCVVFDEAHALRNPASMRYRRAHELARDAQVILLTATPVNNSVWDLYYLLRLFAGDRDFADVGVASLRSAFEEARASVLLGAAPSLLPVLRAVLVRRTRASLLPDVVRRFPEQRPPVPIYYAFGGHDSPDLLAEVGGAIPELAFPAHQERGPAPGELLRRSLFKRLESSVHALKRSVLRYDALLAACMRALDRGLLPDPRMHPAQDDDQLAFDVLLHRPVQDQPRAGRLHSAIERERTLLQRMLTALHGVPDEKLAALVALLAGPLADERVIVFTQFRDTARYLHGALARRFRVALIDGGGALLGLSPIERADVVRRFAPRANGAPPARAHEQVDVLIATDVLSEGFNLQDASAVVSYDLPWNPIRLVQRIGRIDRLGSTHSRIGSYHFLPGDLDRYLGLLDRIAAKTSAIDATVGAEMPAIHASLARALDRGDASFLTRVEEDSDPFALDGKLRTLQRRLTSVEVGDDFVWATLPAATHAGSCAMVAARVGGRVEWLAISGGDARRDENACAALLEEAAAHNVATILPDPVALDVVLVAARRAIAKLQATVESAPLLPRGGGAARAGRRLLELAASAPGGASEQLYVRIERALHSLAGAPDAAISALLAAPDAHSRLGQLLAAIEDLPAPGPRAAPSSRSVRLVGAILRATGER